MRRAGEEQRVAVGRRLRHEVSADGAACSRAVLDEKLPAELRGETRRQHPRRRVGKSARRERHDDPHRSGRVGLCVNRDGECCEYEYK
jgi:hypothetical protein